jgi:translation initiation factor eIF-2B subunit beta
MATAELPKGTKLKLDLFFTKLKQRRAGSTVDTARETVELLRSVVASSCWKLTSELLGIVRSIGQDLVSADPLQLSIGNVVRRVLFIIREEYVTALKFEGTDRPEADSNAQVQSDKESRLSLANLLVEQTDGKVDFTSSTIIDGVNVIKSPIIEEINELLHELDKDGLYKNVAEQAINHIHADETIMTVGHSRLVAEFLLEAAAKKRTFEVFVAEAAPVCSGYDMARELAKAGIKVTVINDCAAFALMARVNKVIIGTHAVMANGGLITYAGIHAVTLAVRCMHVPRAVKCTLKAYCCVDQAAQHAVPVVVVAGLHQLCPMYPFDQDTFNELKSPGAHGQQRVIFLIVVHFTMLTVNLQWFCPA